MNVSSGELVNEKALLSAITRDQESILPLFKSAIQDGREALKNRFFGGAKAQDIVRRHSGFVDSILRLAWDRFKHQLPSEESAALVAVGGYGRSELHPHSDIDLMLIVDSHKNEAIKAFNEAFYHFLWDIGLDVGYSVRTIEDCVSESKKDITIATNIMESRWLVGSKTLAARMQEKTAAPKIWPSRKFFAAKLAEQEQRHQRYNDTAYNLEPNVKGGPGGLRDLQMIGWVSRRHFGIENIRELVKQDFLTREEIRTLIRCRNFLWKVRIGLHFLANRREDRLLFDYQKELAGIFGFRDNKERLAIEQFMKRYYRTIKELRFLNEILLQHFQEVNLPSRFNKVKKINDRFHTTDGFLEANDPDLFSQHPESLLEVFLLFQTIKAIKGIRAGTIRQIQAHLHLIDHGFRTNKTCHRLFLEILQQPDLITRALRRMNTYGVLGAYIPAFGRIVGQMQHDLFHVYTVDAHSLFVVGNLRRFALKRFESELPQANRVMQSVKSPERLYLAGLFHDIAKGRGGDHSALGEKEALQFCKSQGMSNYDAHLVAWLVRQHLMMSWTAQREDISDAAVIQNFAAKVGDQEHLDNLYLLTLADIRGTSPKLWNAWKGQLLEDLYQVTSRALRQGFGNPLQKDQQIAQLQSQVRASLGKQVDAEDLLQHWRDFKEDYFLRSDEDTASWIARTVIDARLLEIPLVAGRYRKSSDVNQILVLAPDSEDLLLRVAGGLGQIHLNIADARIHHLHSGLTMLVFVVFGQQGETFKNQKTIKRYNQQLRRYLLNPSSKPSSDSYALSRTLKHFPIKTHVAFNAAPEGAGYTIMEVIAQDRPALLFHVCKALLDCSVHLVSAKIATFGEKAEDIFYITDRDKQPVVDPSLQSRVRQAIHDALEPAAEERDGAVSTAAASAAG